MASPKKQPYKLKIINKTDINTRKKIIKKIFIRLDLKEYSK